MSTGPAQPRLAVALLAEARPKQWTKNLLVLGAPITGRALDEPANVMRTLVAFVAFCLVASAIYYVNDVVDFDNDRRHPVKRFRPVASGRIRRPMATAAALVLGAGGLLAAFAGAGPALGLVVAGYVGLALTYTFVLRRVVLLDVAAIAGGFLLRAVAGGVAVGVPLSSWFLMVASFASLFLAVGKRRAEFVDLGDHRGDHRATLSEYTEPYLRYLQYSSSTVTIGAYGLWSFQSPDHDPLWAGLSIIPFTLGIFRYALLLETGRGGSPEELLLADRSLQAFGILWVLLVGVGVYAGA